MKYYILRDTFTASAFDIKRHDLKSYYLEDAYQGDAILYVYDSLEAALADFPVQAACVRDCADMEGSDYEADICMVCTASFCNGDLDSIDEEFACIVSKAQTFFMPITRHDEDMFVGLDRFLDWIASSYNGTYVDTDAWLDDVFDNLANKSVEIQFFDSRSGCTESYSFDVHYTAEGEDEDGDPIYGDDMIIEF